MRGPVQTPAAAIREEPLPGGAGCDVFEK